MVYFPTQISGCDSHNPASICSTMAFPPFGILITWLCQLLLTFDQTKNAVPCFIAYLITILVLIAMILVTI